eukprot:11848833-Alexandrium_andersonii.AAC.1
MNALLLALAVAVELGLSHASDRLPHGVGEGHSVLEAEPLIDAASRGPGTLWPKFLDVVDASR